MADEGGDVLGMFVILQIYLNCKNLYFVNLYSLIIVTNSTTYDVLLCRYV